MYSQGLRYQCAIVSHFIDAGRQSRSERVMPTNRARWGVRQTLWEQIGRLWGPLKFRFESPGGEGLGIRFDTHHQHAFSQSSASARTPNKASDANQWSSEYSLNE